ncbi:MAG: MFS transporter [Myxococcaceae bacterium]
MSRSRAWYGLAILTVINLLNYLDRYILAGVMKRMQDEFHLNDEQGGRLATIFMVVYMFMSPLGGYLGDRMPRRVLIAIAVAIWSVATIGSGLAATFGLLMLARAFTGVGEAGYGTTAPSVISDLFPPARRTRMLAVFYTAMPLGAAAGFVLGGAMAEHASWRHAFYVGGIPGLVLALLALSTPEPERGATDAEKPAKIPFAEGIKAIRGSARFWYATAGLTLMTFSVGGLGFWMPKYLSTMRGFSDTEAGLTLGATTVIGGFVGTILGGFAGDRLDKRFGGGGVALSAIGLLCAAPLMVYAAAVDSPWRVEILGLTVCPPVFFSLTFAQLFIFLNNGPLNAALVNSVSAPLRAFAFGIAMLVMHLLGDAASPNLIGRISDAYDLAVAIKLNAIPVALGGLVLLFGLKHWRRGPSDVQPV